MSQHATPRTCATPDCAAPTEKGRTLCRCCRSRKQYAARPLTEAYRQLRSNARRRGKEFTLTRKRFEEVAIQTDYLNLRGRSASSYHIDRIDDSKGYTDDNVQVIPAYINVRKSCPTAAPSLRTFRVGHYCPERGEMIFWKSLDHARFMHDLMTLIEPEYVPPKGLFEAPPF